MVYVQQPRMASKTPEKIPCDHKTLTKSETSKEKSKRLVYILAASSKISSTCNMNATRQQMLEKKGMKLLSADFVPSKYSVLCGRGKGSYNACGNRRFRVIVSMYMPQYIEAPNFTAKTKIIAKVMNIVREACPEGAFIVKEQGRYYELSEKAARKKCATLFRDYLNSQSDAGTTSKSAHSSPAPPQHTQPFLPSLTENPGRAGRCVSLSEDESSYSSSSSSSLVSASFFDVDTNCYVSICDEVGDISLNSFGHANLPSP
jgi:hypothetical protein